MVMNCSQCRGVRSPWLFNFYLDDVVRDMKWKSVYGGPEWHDLFQLFANNAALVEETEVKLYRFVAKLEVDLNGQLLQWL